MISLELDVRILELDLQITALRQEQKRLKAERARRYKIKYDPDLHDLFNLILESPGIDREGIRYSFHHLSESQLTGLLTKARRDYRLIKNRGTDRYSRWYPVKGASYGPNAVV
jgi:hypothetical protein